MHRSTETQRLIEGYKDTRKDTKNHRRIQRTIEGYKETRAALQTHISVGCPMRHKNADRKISDAKLEEPMGGLGEMVSGDEWNECVARGGMMVADGWRNEWMILWMFGWMYGWYCGCADGWRDGFKEQNELMGRIQRYTKQ